MQVFTAIYLAEGLHPNARQVDETPGLASMALSAREFLDVLRPRIARVKHGDTAGQGSHEHPTQPTIA
jgi:hypothetical protein